MFHVSCLVRCVVAVIELLRPTSHKTSHFGDVLPSQSLIGLVLKKLTLMQQKQTTQYQQEQGNRIDYISPALCTPIIAFPADHICSERGSDRTIPSAA